MAGAERPGRRWAGAWVDLLDELDEARVLVLPDSPSAAGGVLAQRAGHVAYGRDRLMSGAPWDVIVIDGAAAWRAASLPELLERLAQDGRIVALLDNRLSLLRAADRLLRGQAAETSTTLKALRRRVQEAGLEVVSLFGLLRSSSSPVSAFELGSPHAAAAVIDAAVARVSGPRAAGLRALRTLALRGRAGNIVPAWLLVARRVGQAEPRPLRPTGRIGNEDSRESLVVLGEPPAELEKLYEAQPEADSEANALAELERAGIAFVPRLRGSAPLRVRQTWLSGRPLDPRALDGAELSAWVARAAAVLAQTQEATRDSAGRVLVHGDYWLGNLLVSGDEIAGVLDWNDSHRGSPDEDARHLVETLADAGYATAEQAAALRSVVRRELGRP